MPEGDQVGLSTSDIRSPRSGLRHIPHRLGSAGRQPEISDDRHLLGPRRERPRCRDAEQRDELAALHPRNHSSTSSYLPFAERTLWNVRLHQSALAPENLTTLAHFSTS